MTASESILDILDFGNEAGDDVSIEELSEYFVEQNAFRPFSESRERLLVAKGRKGMGKSALMKWVAAKVAQRDDSALIVSLRGADLVRSRFGLVSPLVTANEVTLDWMVRLSTAVNRHLAKVLNLALTDDQITLVETAELEGFKSRNFVSCLVDRLQSLLEKNRKVTKLRAQNEIELLKRAKDRDVWIIVDDLDATFQNTDDEAASLAGFFTACRYLIQDMRGLYVRASIRSEVWSLVRPTDESLDKSEQYIREILWERKGFATMLALRVKASLKQAGREHEFLDNDDAERTERILLSMAFERRMKWGDSRRKPSEAQPTLTRSRSVDADLIIYTLSYERPRWAIQLCKLAQAAALRKRLSRINRDSIDEVWGEYGNMRIADLVAEHKHQCARVKELLNAFRGAQRLMSKDQLFSWVNNHVSEHLEVQIERRPVRAAKEVAHFLYRIGFIVARSETERGEYEHFRFDQLPDLLVGRTDDDFSLKWEIHPCYREALDIEKLNQSHREKFARMRGRHSPRNP